MKGPKAKVEVLYQLLSLSQVIEKSESTQTKKKPLKPKKPKAQQNPSKGWAHEKDKNKFFLLSQR